MNKEFLLNTLFLVVINLIIKPFYIFGIDRAVQNRVGEEHYGIYFALYSFTFLFQIVNDFGIQNFNSREISQHRQLLDKYFSGILSLKIVLGIVYLCVATIITAFIPSYWAVLPMILSLVMCHILASLRQYLASNVAALGMYRLNSVLSVLDRVLLIIMCAVLLWVSPFEEDFKIEWFIHAQNISLLITALVTFAIIFKQVKTFKISWHLPLFLLILRGAMPYALSIFLMTIYTRTDVVMLERMLTDGSQQAGIYASAYRLLDAVNVLGLLFAGLLMPMFAKQLKDKIDIDPLVRFSFQLIMVASIIIAATVWFYRTDIMQLLYKQATPFSGDVLGVLMGSFVAVSGTYIFSTLIGAAGHVAQMNKTFIAAFIINIGLNTALIPQYKALGAASSTLITQFFVMIVLIFLSKKLNILRGGVGWVLHIVVFVLAIVGLNIIIKTCQISEIWYIQMLIVVVLSGFLALGMGFLNYKKVAQLPRSP
ncbi:MAG: oligosaccharide flippase family protein [Saprospiraceae bacterium]|nr:oligosaccharide flippase family protein [Saprospiraceae bacterium]